MPKDARPIQEYNSLLRSVPLVSPWCCFEVAFAVDFTNF